jgi:DNA invertase Pin-like site-specific DNA recombinase
MKTISREEKYDQMCKSLNEKQWRQYLGGEAKECGNVAEVAREAKVSRNTVKRGMKEIEAGEVYQPGERIRQKGGGRKALAKTDPSLLADLKNLLAPKGPSVNNVIILLGI